MRANRSSTLRLRIGNYEIPKHTLTSVFFIVGTSSVTFSGVARGEEGTEIMRMLRRLAKQSVSYEATDLNGTRSTGIGTISNLKFEEITTTPRLVIYSGELVEPF
jgi:hypothetical protein